MSTELHTIPDTIRDVDQLEDILSEPSQAVVEALGRIEGDILVLGAGGKMGPSLARMAKRASDAAKVDRRVIAVDRFRLQERADRLQAVGVETVRCELLDPMQVLALPDAPNVVFMAGRKFGSTGQESLTWAMNAFLPGMVCQRYSASRIVAYSTGNVYGLSPVVLGGSLESDPLNAEGEYAASTLGRERIFEHFSLTEGTPTAIIRLNYATEMRYGVLVDVAQKVWEGEPVDVTMGCANAIWQTDAVAMSLLALEHASSPPFVLNVAGPELLSFRRMAQEFGELMGKQAIITGAEAPDALISNGQLGHRLYGYPKVTVQQMMRWIADWVMRGGESLGKPTHFETRNGKY